MTHNIVITGPLVFARARRLAPDRPAVAKKEFEHILHLGFILPSSSLWALPLYMVLKKSGDSCPCSNHRYLNKATVPERHPIPDIHDFTSARHGYTIFRKVDLQKAYHQIPVEHSDILKAAILTLFGLFESPRMPFGLRNGAPTSEGLFEQELHGLTCCFACLDDILFYSTTAEAHKLYLRQVLARLNKFGLFVNALYSELSFTELDFLGHHVNANCIRPLPTHVTAIHEYRQLPTTTKLCEFLASPAITPLNSSLRQYTAASPPPSLVPQGAKYSRIQERHR